jgi:PUA domain protein
MFKKFTKQDIHGQTQAKSSVMRAIKQSIVEQYPLLEEHIDELLPKKQPLYLVKCLDRVVLLQSQDQFLFFQSFDGPWMPTLKILHKFPDILPIIQVDKGAIKFVLKGADIMCPGMTSPGAKIHQPLEKDRVVCIRAEGKEHSLCVGMTSLSTEEM